MAQHTTPPLGSTQGKEAEERAGSQSHPLPIVALAMAPGLLRSDTQQKTLIIPRGLHLVQLQLAVENNQPYESYFATLETVEGAKVWSKEGLKTMPEGEMQGVLLELPSSLLGNKDYILKLRGLQAPQRRQINILARHKISSRKRLPPTVSVSSSTDTLLKILKRLANGRESQSTGQTVCSGFC